jgi:S1-C subfamily serine protease
MKKFLNAVIILILLFTLSGCTVFGVKPGADGDYTATFMVDGAVYHTAKFNDGNAAPKPADPAKTNMKFTGWYTAAGNPYGFVEAPSKSLTLYAKFELDYLSVTNLITTNYIRANVKIINEVYNLRGSLKVDVITGIGSGVIFYDQGGKYYLLTNNHVIYLHGRTRQTITVQDYKGVQYAGAIKSGSAQAGYDLAVLSFAKGDALQTIDVAENNVETGGDVIAIGQPEGQNNALSYGKALGYETVKLEGAAADESNVTFDVLRHSAPTDNGSSGCAVLNSGLKLVAVHYAGPDTVGFADFGFAVPALKITEYLNKYIWS